MMLKVFEIAMVQAKITYNSYGLHDLEGCFFVIKEELERYGGLEAYTHKVDIQEIKIEPLVIRANVGDYIEIHVINLLPEYSKYSENITGVTQDEEEVLTGRFFAGSVPKIILLHNHLFINPHRHHGLYGALVIEEEGATFHNPHNNKELRFGTQAVIRRKDGTSFREFILFVHDFAFKGLNYCAEPVSERLKNGKDPAYIFSSFVHGDPSTPILETYPEDEIKIHLLNSGDRCCLLHISGMPIQRNANSISVVEKYSAGDYLYYLDEIDNAKNCLWGIVRVYGKYNEALLPLCSEKEQVFLTPLSLTPDSIIRHYEVVALYTKLIYKYDNKDNSTSDRVVFVLMKDLEMVLAGKVDVEPLVLYVNDGEWIEITLHNALDTRISLKPQPLQYDPLHNSGFNLGYNEWEQTVAPGESRRYLWYAKKGGKCILQLLTQQ